MERGRADRPHHAVINAENYHAVQLLLHLYEGQVDCLYLDPPYNTGARDWTYNNDYVDSGDAFRHSKWLSFMEKRLKLAKRLLKEGDGVLVITIDENEVHHLGVLLEQIFPNALRQMVTICINPSGVSGGGLSRVEEYAFFCFLAGTGAVKTTDDMLSEVTETDDQEVAWESLLRRGNVWYRSTRRNLCYPIYINLKDKKIIGAGKPFDGEDEALRESDNDEFAVAWPVRKDGRLGIWRVEAQKLRSLAEQGFAYATSADEKRGTWTIKYLMSGTVDAVESGLIEVIGRGKNGEAILQAVRTRETIAKTMWKRGRHTAGGSGGTQVLASLLSERGLFPFPKSLYAVKDCLSAAIGNRPNALTVDFFAGSGTTFHATCLLNAEDGGQRRCILVTNNEVDAEKTKTLHEQGLYKGDAEFEKFGIFGRVTRPRCEAVVTGQRADGTPVPGNHIGGRPLSDGFEENVSFFRLNYLNPDRVDMGHQFAAIAPLLWLEAGGFGAAWESDDADYSEPGFSLPPGTHYGILFKESRFSPFRDALVARPDITHVFLVTDSEEAYAEMRAALPPTIRARMLYRDYLRSFRIGGTGESGTTL